MFAYKDESRSSHPRVVDRDAMPERPAVLVPRHLPSSRPSAKAARYLWLCMTAARVTRLSQVESESTSDRRGMHHKSGGGGGGGGGETRSDRGAAEH
jgi:hypothetical protein